MPDQSLANVLADLLAEVPRDNRPGEVQVLLHRPVVQVRHVDTLPPVGSSALAALVDHQASTFFRKNGHPLVTSASWLPAVRDAPRRAVMAAVEVELAEAIVEGAARAGFEVGRCRVAELPGGDALDLLPQPARDQLRRRRRRSLGRMAGITVLAWVVVLAAWTIRFGLEVHRTRSDLIRLDGARQALLAGQAVRHRAEAMLFALDAADPARRRLQDQLLAVASALPDSAYLSSLTVDTSGGGLLTGGAYRATDVVAALERAHAAPNPRLDGAITPDPLTSARWERFTILLGGERP
jgi:hypothetical protein